MYCIDGVFHNYRYISTEKVEPRFQVTLGWWFLQRWNLGNEQQKPGLPLFSFSTNHKRSFPDAPCIEYLIIFANLYWPYLYTLKVIQMLVSIPYMEHLGFQCLCFLPTCLATRARTSKMLHHQLDKPTSILTPITPLQPPFYHSITLYCFLIVDVGLTPQFLENHDFHCFHMPYHGL